MFSRFFQKKQPEKPRRRSYFAETSSLSKELATREKVDWNVVIGQLPDPDEVLRASGKDFTAYRQLMVDSQVRACANSRKAGVLSLNWDIDRGQAKSKQAKLIQDLYADLDIDALNHAILNAPFFGFQPIEIMWGKVGGYILPVDLIPKNPEWFGFDKDSKLRLLTLGSAVLGEELPDRKFLTPTYNDINNNFYNPYGDRLLSSCFWPVTFKKSGFKWWVTFAEKYGMPYIVGKMPRSVMDSDRTDMLNSLKNMVMDAAAVITDDSSVEFIEASKTSSSDLYKELIISSDEAISKAILGQTLTTDSGNGSGSYALGKVHNNVRQDIVDTDRRIVERTHNQLIRWIYDINFGSGAIPKYSMYEEEDVDKNLADRDEVLTRGLGVKFSKDYICKAYNLNDTDFEVTETSADDTGAGAQPAQKPIIPSEEDDKQPKFAERAEDDLDWILAQFDDAQLQSQIEEVLRPMLKLVKHSGDYAEFKKELKKISPEMSVQEIESQLASILFLSETLGRFDVKKKDYSP